MRHRSDSSEESEPQEHVVAARVKQHASFLLRKMIHSIYEFTISVTQSMQDARETTFDIGHRHNVRLALFDIGHRHNAW